WHSDDLGSAGGGVIVIDAPTVVLDGELRARGLNVHQDRGTGAGGTVVVQAGTLSGTGSINVSGGDSSYYDAGYGGGGRVAVYADDATGWSPTALTVRAGRGSRDYSHGAPGTYFQLDGTGTFGDLLVDGDGSGADDLFPTTLPTIGRGLVGAVIPAGADLWIEPTDAETRFSVGAVGMWVRIDGALYRVTGERADRRGLLLEGAAGLVEVGEPYVGFYRFDTVTVRGRAKLLFTDGEEVAAWDVETNSTATTLDLQPPVIVIDSPTATDLFASGDVIPVSATVTDADAVVSVTFSFDGQTFVDTTAPYEWTVAAPAVDGSGTFELVVEAVDPENNVGRVTRDVPVEGVPAGAPPTASFVCPTPVGAVLAPGASMAVHAEAQDDHDVARVEFYFDSVLVAT
ncbi:MAG: Ig-like domain-containing protein, partial [Acidobacteriota bacterium]